MKNMKTLALAAAVALTSVLANDAHAQRGRSMGGASKGTGISFKPSYTRVSPVSSASSVSSFSRNYSPPPSRSSSSFGSSSRSTTSTRMTSSWGSTTTVKATPSTSSRGSSGTASSGARKPSTKEILSRRTGPQKSGKVSGATPPKKNSLTIKKPRAASAKKANITGTTTVGKKIHVSKYSHLRDVGKPRNGGKFSDAQRRAIRAENASNNGWVMRSDQSGKRISGRQAQVDHMAPKSKGGPNTVGNSQMLSGAENRAKGAKQAVIRTKMTQPNVGRNMGATTQARVTQARAQQQARNQQTKAQQTKAQQTKAQQTKAQQTKAQQTKAQLKKQRDDRRRQVQKVLQRRKQR